MNDVLNKKTVTYEEFGAKGDGLTDDLDAIVAAHAYANEHGLPVRASDTATYYLAKGHTTAEIRTDTDWGKAHFVIDDREILVPDRQVRIFDISSDKPAEKIVVPAGFTVKRDAKNFGMSFGKKCLVRFTCDDSLIYKRFGDIHQISGIGKNDVILLDEAGNIDPTTPLVWDYSEGVTSITVYEIDDAPITVSGGFFKTITNVQEFRGAGGYYDRGIRICRANVTLKNVTHTIEGEPDDPRNSTRGCPYFGFVQVYLTNNALVTDCVLTGHARIHGGANYEIICESANNVTFRNCTQTDDICDMNKWGCMASSGCKNITWDHCVLSRFDDHRGLCNATIRDSEVGMLINLIGAGEFRLENSVLHAVDNNSAITLRADYGASWDGNITIRNCVLKGKPGKTVYLFKAWWHDFDHGYLCHFGRNITVDGLKIENDAPLFFVTNMLAKYEGEPIADISKHPNHPYVMPGTVTLRGIDREIRLAEQENVRELFRDTVFTDLQPV